MSGNPRKFSEKIAIHQRKLNEEQNAFESIMAEVSTITKTNDPIVSYSGQWGLGPSSGAFFIPGGGIGGDMIGGQRMPAVMHSGGRNPGSGGHGHVHRSHTFHPYQRAPSSQFAPNTVLPMRQQSFERPQIPPPYLGGHVLLAPPQDISWRRTHSDPGLHASVMQPTIPGIHPSAHGALTHSPPQNNVSPVGSPIGDKPPGSYFLEPKINAPQYRPRSCENVPNINIHPSEPVAGPQVPISNNTGSLPDLPSSLIPAQAHLQQLESGKSTYVQSIGTTADAGNVAENQTGGPHVGAGGGLHQQRHSIQLPVQYSQGLFASGPSTSGPKYFSHSGTSPHMLRSNTFSQNTSQPGSPMSAPNSPNETAGSGDSPGPSPSQVQSPASPYYSLRTQLQNINIDSQEPIVSTQQNTYFDSGALCNVSSMSPTAYHPYGAMSSNQQMHPSDQYHQQQIYQAFLFGQQSPTQLYPQHANAGGQFKPQLSSPTGQIPDIIFTGADGSVSGVGSAFHVNSIGNYLDPVEIISSDLRISLDPVDLESLHGLSNEQGLHIDAASEDELRRDRM